MRVSSTVSNSQSSGHHISCGFRFFLSNRPNQKRQGPEGKVPRPVGRCCQSWSLFSCAVLSGVRKTPGTHFCNNKMTKRTSKNNYKKSRFYRFFLKKQIIIGVPP